MPSLLDKRLVFVTGKGGVGRSTVALAIGLAAARRGRRTIVCEVAGQERAARALAREDVGYAETEVAPGLAAISVDPQGSIEEYLRVQLGSAALAGLLFDNRLFQYFAAATPGLSELVTVGKVWDLAQDDRHTEGGRYDLVIVDAPASGHGLGLLRAPATFRDVARVGPIRRQAGIIDAYLRDPAVTGLVAVALAEEMPVSETLEFAGRLEEEAGMAVDRIVLNGLLPDRFKPEEIERMRAVAGARRNGEGAAAEAGRNGEGAATEAGRDGQGAAAEAGRNGDGAARTGPNGRGASGAVGRAVGLALAEHHRVEAQGEQRARLESGTGQVALALPLLFDAELGLPELYRLSRVLEPGL